MRDQTLIPDLEYADDMCLLSNSTDELEEMLLDLDWQPNGPFHQCPKTNSRHYMY